MDKLEMPTAHRSVPTFTTSGTVAPADPLAELRQLARDIRDAESANMLAREELNIAHTMARARVPAYHPINLRIEDAGLALPELEPLAQRLERALERLTATNARDGHG